MFLLYRILLLNLTIFQVAVHGDGGVPPPSSQIRMLHARHLSVKSTISPSSSQFHESQPTRLPSARKRKLESESSVEIVEDFNDSPHNLDPIDNFDMLIDEPLAATIKQEQLEEKMDEPVGRMYIKKKAPRTTSLVRIFSNLCLISLTFNIGFCYDYQQGTTCEEGQNRANRCVRLRHAGTYPNKY